MDSSYKIIFARFISALGSVLTSASIPLYLIHIELDYLIPYNVMALALGRIVATKFFIQKTQHYSARKILTAGSLLQLPIIFLFCVLLISKTSQVNYFFPFLIFSIISISTLIESTAQGVLSKSKINEKLINIDSTAMTLARVCSPGLAVILLKVVHFSVEVILVIDGLSFVVAFFLFSKATTLKEIKANVSKEKISFQKFHLLQKLKNDYSFWMPLVLVGLGASTYNLGVFVFLNRLGLNTNQIAIFSIIQNLGMVMTGSFLIKNSKLAYSKTWPHLLSSVGLIGIATSGGIVQAGIFTFTMAVGMVLFMQGMRLKISKKEINEIEKRFEFGMFATLNSLITLTVSLIIIPISMLIPWKWILIVGGLLLALPLLFSDFAKIKSKIRIAQAVQK